MRQTPVRGAGEGTRVTVGSWGPVSEVMGVGATNVPLLSGPSCPCLVHLPGLTPASIPHGCGLCASVSSSAT